MPADHVYYEFITWQPQNRTCDHRSRENRQKPKTVVMVYVWPGTHTVALRVQPPDKIVQVFGFAGMVAVYERTNSDDRCVRVLYVGACDSAG